VEEYRIDCIAGSLHHAGFHLDAMLPQKRNAFSCHLVVWIITADIDLFDAVFHDRKRAWWLFAIMAARLQRHIHFRAFRILVKTCKRRTFRMQITVSRMIPLSNDPVILHDHRTDKRIRIDRAGSFFRKLDRKLHIFLFVCHFITFFVLFTQKLSPGHISLCPGAYPHRNQMAVIVHHTLPFSPATLSLLSHPDYTVGFGISPNHASLRAGYTAGGESHPAPSKYLFTYNTTVL